MAMPWGLSTGREWRRMWWDDNEEEEEEFEDDDDGDADREAKWIEETEEECATL